MQGVYQILNTVNGRKYVGSAQLISRRWIRHRKDLRGGRHHAAYLQRSWDKHGPAAFEFSVLEVVEDAAQLIAVEQRWIDDLGAFGPAGYNSRQLAASPLGSRHTPEAKAKIAAASKGRYIPPANPEEASRNRSVAQRNKPPITEETRAKMQAAQIGRRHPPEVRAKMSAARKGKPVSAKQLATMFGRIPSEDQLRRQAEKVRGRKQTEEHTKKIAAANTGRKRTAETIERMRVSAKARVARQRAARLGGGEQLQLSF